MTAVITTHQRPAALGRALDSVLAQTRPVDDVLVVEDGVDPETAEVVASRRGGPPIRHLRVSPGRVCPAASRNLAVRESRSTHIAFLDDDDAWAPDKNEIQVACIGGRVLACGNALRSDGRPYFPDGPDRDVTPRELRRHNPVITSTVLVRRRDVAAAGGFRESTSLRGVEDFDLWLRLADCAGSFVYSGAQLAIYECEDADRLSTARLRGEVRLARVRALDLARKPTRGGSWLAVAKSWAAVGVATTHEVFRVARR